MAKTLTLAKASAKLAALETKIIELLDAQQAAIAREVLEVGKEYAIYQGRGEERTVVAATLIAQRVDAEGTTRYAFQINETGEFAANVTARVLAVELPEGEKKPKSSDQIKAVIDKLTADKDALEAKLEELAAAEAVEVGQNYQIKIGRGKSAEVVTAHLLGIGNITKTKKLVAEDGTESISESTVEQLNFFYGAGFDARTVLVSRSALVFNTAEDDAEAAAEAQADADAAGSDE